MPFRLIQLIVSEDIGRHVHEYLRDYELQGHWYHPLNDGNVMVSIIIEACYSEDVLDLLERNYGSLEEFAVTVMPVEAVLPRREPEKMLSDAAKRKQWWIEMKKAASERVSREELYADAMDSTRLTGAHVSLISLSAIVCAIGLLHNNLAVIIGAMMIAPLLGPNIALPLATSLADRALAWNAVKSVLAAIVVILSLSLAIGALFGTDPTIHEIHYRTRTQTSDTALALASGMAGALAFTSGFAASLVGVMVAVALLPPLATAGLLIGSGHVAVAFGSFLLFATNLISVQLAGLTAFLIQKIKPAQELELRKAWLYVLLTGVLWAILLLALQLFVWSP